jgi:hypothetical protein
MIALLSLMLASATTPAASPQQGAGRAEFRVSARIVRDSAAVGEGRAAPVGAQPRAAELSAADGSPIAAIVYDFQ